MEKTRYVSDLAPGETVHDIFLLASAQQGQARNGPYWRVSFRDATGNVDGKIWSPLSQQFAELKAGELVQVQGRVTVYRDRNEIAVDALRILDEAEVADLNLADYTVSSGHDSDLLFRELEDLCRSTFTHAPWKKFYKALLRNEEIAAKLKVASAAKAMHHAYVGGLLEHTLSVARLCMRFADHYPYLDRQVLLAGAICHDMGKIWELSSGLLTDYTTEGRLLGHITIVLEKIAPLLDKSGLEPELADHLKHLILSHHGTREFGSPCLPSTAEAFALHYADNLDAKLNQVQQALGGLEASESGWSAYIPGLERSVFRAVQSPGAQSSKNRPSAATSQESQCLLLLKE